MPHLPTRAGTGVGYSHEVGLQSTSCRWVAGTQGLKPSLPPRVYMSRKLEVRTEMELTPNPVRLEVGILTVVLNPTPRSDNSSYFKIANSQNRSNLNIFIKP